MTNGEDKLLSEMELERLLKFSSKPEPAADFMEKMALRIAATATDVNQNNVIPFRPRVAAAKLPPARSLRWPFGAAMAASLVLGLWIGGSGQISTLVEQVSEVAMLDVSSTPFPGTLDEISTTDVDTQS